MHTMKVEEIMTRNPFIISPDKTVQDAAKLMKQEDLGALPVGTHPEKVVGMITDRDITLRLVAENKSAAQTLVGDVMTPNVYTCSAHTSTDDAAELMLKNNICRLAVIKDGHVTGIVTLAQLLHNKSRLWISDNVLHKVLVARTKHHTESIRPN